MGRDYIHREHKRRSEQRAGDHSVNCGKELDLEFRLSFEMQRKVKMVINRGRNDNQDHIYI